MKKTFKTFALMLLAAVAFSSCVDVPTPYNLPSSGTEYVFSQSFASSLGDFTSQSETGTLSWKIDYSSAVVTGYGDWNGTGTKSNQAGITYLISPEIDLSGIDNAYVVISQAINYAKNTMTDDHHLLIRQAGTESWTDLSMDFNGLGSSFTFVSQNVQLPQSYLGMKIQLALKHIAHDSYSSTWEVKSIMVAKGTVPDANSGNDDSGTETSAITCAKALEIINSLSDGAASTETYAVTGYIVESFTNSGKLCFWMSDTKDGEKIIQAYNASLPQGVTAFQVGMKVTATGKLKKYVNKNTGASTPEVENPTVAILEDGSGQGGETPVEEGTPVTCAEAVDLTNALENGATSTDTYTVTGYITEVVSSVSRNQQSFWMADTKDGGNVFEAYWANLPSGVSAFVVGMKVKITGKLVKYLKNAEEVIPEIKNADVVVLEDADGGQGGGDEGGETVTDLVNGGFEDWVSDSEAEGWKSASSASSATVSKSSDAHDGSFACLIAAGGSANKRLATQEMTLEAGSYKFSYYAKAATAAFAQTKGGYVHVNDDGRITDSYQYPKTFTDLNNNEWTLVTNEFELTSRMTVCIVIMNPKNNTNPQYTSQDILVDDAKLEKIE